MRCSSHPSTDVVVVAASALLLLLLLLLVGWWWWWSRAFGGRSVLFLHVLFEQSHGVVLPFFARSNVAVDLCRLCVCRVEICGGGSDGQ